MGLCVIVSCAGCGLCSSSVSVSVSVSSSGYCVRITVPRSSVRTSSVCSVRSVLCSLLVGTVRFDTIRYGTVRSFRSGPVDRSFGRSSSSSSFVVVVGRSVGRVGRSVVRSFGRSVDRSVVRTVPSVRPVRPPSVPPSVRVCPTLSRYFCLR